jgi:hypothetical protein
MCLFINVYSFCTFSGNCLLPDPSLLQRFVGQKLAFEICDRFHSSKHRFEHCSPQAAAHVKLVCRMSRSLREKLDTIERRHGGWSMFLDSIRQALFPSKNILETIISTRHRSCIPISNKRAVSPWQSTDFRSFSDGQSFSTTSLKVSCREV